MTIAMTLMAGLIATMFVSTTLFAVLYSMREGQGKPVRAVPNF